jgi:hypothetical protein
MLDPDVRAILTTLEYLPNNKARITTPQLERAVYEKVNEVLTRINGKWKGGKTQAHVFLSDPEPAIRGILTSNEMPPDNPFAFFPTPKIVVDVMLPELRERKHVADDTPDYTFTPRRILEPSAGTGGIADHVFSFMLPQDTLHCVEIAPIQAAMLRNKGYTVYEQDFLTFTANEPYDYIFMNPPFSVENDKTAYMTHIYHAFSMLADNGIMYAVMPNGWEFNQASKFRAFREFVGLHGVSKEKFPSGTFKESGTMIETTVMELRKNTPISEVHTRLTALYIDNDTTLIKAAQKCKNVQEFITFLYDVVWKEAYRLGGFVHIGSVDAEKLYKRLKEDTP